MGSKRSIRRSCCGLNCPGLGHELAWVLSLERSETLNQALSEGLYGSEIPVFGAKRR
jgi:hypothetical protein